MDTERWPLCRPRQRPRPFVNLCLEAYTGNEPSLPQRSHRLAGIGTAQSRGRRGRGEGAQARRRGREWQHGFQRSQESREFSPWKWRRPRSRPSHALHSNGSSFHATELPAKSPCPGRRNLPALIIPVPCSHGCIYCFSQTLPNFDSCFISLIIYRSVREPFSTPHSPPGGKGRLKDGVCAGRRRRGRDSRACVSLWEHLSQPRCTLSCRSTLPLPGILPHMSF